MATPLATLKSTVITLNAQDYFLIAPTGVLDGQVKCLIDELATTSVTLTVLGHIFSEASFAFRFLNLDVFGNHTVYVGENSDVVAGRDFAAAWMEGEGCALYNAGSISGGAAGYFAGWASGEFQNDGQMIGMRYYGVKFLNSANTVVENGGLISGLGGIVLENAAATILNQGQIRSRSATLAAVDARTGLDGMTLRNSGEVTGLVLAVVGSSIADTVINSGLIDGNVDLGAGNDTFRGKQGTLEGTLSGGAQNDFLAGGEGDQLIYGGSENDILNGNAGDDVLFGGNGYDTFVFSRRGDDDTISGFQNGTDLIDMRAFHFANFAALSAKAIDAPGGMLIDLQAQNGGTVFIAGFTKALFGASDVIL